MTWSVALAIGITAAAAFKLPDSPVGRFRQRPGSGGLPKGRVGGAGGVSPTRDHASPPVDDQAAEAAETLNALADAVQRRSARRHSARDAAERQLLCRTLHPHDLRTPIHPSIAGYTNACQQGLETNPSATWP